jgi:hypothetical protein
MYCPVCFQDTLKLRSTGVVKISFNAKSRDTSLFTFNVSKENQEDLLKKLREKIVDFFSWYSQFQNKVPLVSFDALSSDFQCINQCKIDYVNTKISVVGLLFSMEQIVEIIQQEAPRYSLDVNLKKK